MKMLRLTLDEGHKSVLRRRRSADKRHQRAIIYSRRKSEPANGAIRFAIAPYKSRGKRMRLIERLKGDVVTLKGALRTLKMTTPIAKNPSRVFPDGVDGLAEKFGDAPALLSDRERLSYRQLAERSNRYARWALAHGLAKGDAVCLMMPNRPEFMAIWLGLTRAGGVVALVNTNLAGAALA